MTTEIRTAVEGVTARIIHVVGEPPLAVTLEWSGAGSMHRETLYAEDLARALAEVGVAGVLTPEQVEVLAEARLALESGMPRRPMWPVGGSPTHDAFRRHTREQLDIAGIDVADTTPEG